jgi:hypothetical protein
MSAGFAPQDGAQGLVAHPHRFTLRDHPATWTLPNLCAACGTMAAERIVCSKVFRRTHSDSPTEHIVSSVAVPFCAACAASHRQQTPEITTLRKVLLSFATAEMLGAVLPGMAAAFVVWLALKDLVNGRFLRALTMLPIAGLFGLIAWYQRRHVWRETAHLRVPAQSSVARAFDFSDDLAAVFEPPRFVCTIQDPAFAQAFESLNRDRLWIAGSPAVRAEQQAAQRKTRIGIVIFVVIALVVLLIDWFN